ncbi:hypothetical protein SynTAK9802_01491 [Synechococcus sp. TAK9802]|nr:hypothetical protein SynTAK9802_01491 [Synechococcus sp. TAK9802]
MHICWFFEACFILLDLSSMCLGPSQINRCGSSEGALFA